MPKRGAVTPSPRRRTRLRGRYRAGRYSRRRWKTGRRRGIVQKTVYRAIKAAQEKKRRELVPSDLTQHSVMQVEQFGIDIKKGDTIKDRHGDSVFLEGVRVRVQIEATSADVTTLTREACFHMYLCETPRDNSYNAIWFLDANSKTMAFTTAANDRSRMMQRKNLLEYKVLGKVKKRIVTPNNNYTDGKVAVNYHQINRYWKIGKHVTWKTISDVTPFDSNLIKPNISLVYYFLIPQTTLTLANPGVFAHVRVTWYFRE